MHLLAQQIGEEADLLYATLTLHWARAASRGLIPWHYSPPVGPSRLQWSEKALSKDL